MHEMRYASEKIGNLCGFDFQMRQIRDFYDAEHHRVAWNWRPSQPTNWRDIYRSWRAGWFWEDRVDFNNDFWSGITTRLQLGTRVRDLKYLNKLYCTPVFWLRVWIHFADVWYGMKIILLILLSVSFIRHWIGVRLIEFLRYISNNLRSFTTVILVYALWKTETKQSQNGGYNNSI